MSSNTRRSSPSGQRYREDASQMQVHHFDANDEDEEEDDDDDGNEDDDDDNGEEEDDDNRRDQTTRRHQVASGSQTGDPYSDPYNTRLQQQQQQQQQQEQLFEYPQGYDSMSTILEVDSEASRASPASSSRSSPGAAISPELPRDVGSPLEVQTTADGRATAEFAGGQQGRRRSAGSPVGPILSPDDKFGGTLSALAAQVERLQRRAAATTTPLRPADKSEEPAAPSLAQASEHTGNYQASSQYANAAKQSDARQATPEASEAPTTRLPKSRTNSAESLMMINLSPLGSPKIRFSPVLLKRTAGPSAGDELEATKRIVEVSNKSTNTVIDLALMDEMARKYFVDQCDRATQSIKFDCDDDELNTIDMSRSAGQPARNRWKQAAESHPKTRPQMKSVSVGTEKFSRERFSLLPQTKTRSTQTKANLSDSDLGTSETRRFKLSHLSELGPIITSKKSRNDPARLQSSFRRTTPGETPIGVADERENSEQSSASQSLRMTQVDSNRRDETSGAASEGQKRAKLLNLREQEDENGAKVPISKQQVAPEGRPKSPGIQAEEPRARSSKFGDESSHSSSSSSSPSSSSPADSIDSSSIDDKKQLATRKPTTSSSQKKGLQTTPKEAEPQPTTATDKNDTNPVKSVSSQQQQQQIPSLKTELRVIIEFADSKQKQRSEMLSNSNLNKDGILSKRTELVTSNHLAASPREVLDRLESVGQRHSLMYQQQQHHHSQQSITTPKSSRAGSSSVLSASALSPASALASNREAIRRAAAGNYAADHDDQATKHWHEISKSTVRNEIETDTRTGRSGRARNGAPANEDIILSSQAEIRRLPDNKNAVKLQSRASKRYPINQATGKENAGQRAEQRAERLLVESVAGFDESKEAGEIESPLGKDQFDGPSSQTLDPPTPAPSNVGKATSQHIWDKAQVGGQSTKAMISPKDWPDRQRQQQQPKQRILAQNGSPRGDQVPLVRQTPSPARGGRLPSTTIDTNDDNQQHPRAHLGASDNTRETSRTSTPSHQHQATRKKIEFEEETEDRRQVTRNGRLVYDDRLREHRFESLVQSAANVGSPREDNGPTPGPASPQRMANVPRTNFNIRRDQQLQQQQTKYQPIPLNTTTSSAASPSQLHQRQPVAPAKTAARPLASPPALFADQTESNLSSDLETMDSGFVQSGAGSSNNIHLKPAGQFDAHRRLPLQPSPSGSGLPPARLPAPVVNPTGGPVDHQHQPTWGFRPKQVMAAAGPTMANRGMTTMNEVDGGIAFVDDEDGEEEDDDFVEQLGGSSYRLDSKQRANRRMANDATARSQPSLLPPIEFQNEGSPLGQQIGSKTNLKQQQQQQQPTIRRSESMPKLSGGPVATRSDLLRESELTTRLTRRKFNKGENLAPQLRRRTLTKLEQSLVAPDLLGDEEHPTRRQASQANSRPSPENRGRLGGSNRCHQFRAQVMFESDTDSAADRQSVNSSRSGSKVGSIIRQQQQQPQKGSIVKKELLTETKYSLTKGGTTSERNVSKRIPEKGPPFAAGHARKGSARFVAGGPEPNWDYSLKVNRMRGDKVDSRVDTYIKHTRLPLINSKAA